MFVLVTLLVLTACESKDNNSKKDIEIKDTKESVSTSDNYKMLTNQQKEYLSSIGFEEDSINKMSYESVNYYLLGTGFELYNQSSGVEIFGISYKLTDKEKKQIEDYQNDDGKTFHKDLKKITYKEAENIRGREKKIRLSHFLKYQGEIRYIREKEKFALFLPVEQMYWFCLKLMTIIH